MILASNYILYYYLLLNYNFRIEDKVIGRWVLIIEKSMLLLVLKFGINVS